MKASSRFLTAALGLCILAAASPAFAQFKEFGASNLTLKKTYLRSASDAREVGMSFEPVLSPMPINCPGNSDCFVQVQFDASIDGLHPGDNIAVRVTVDGQSMKPYPTTNLTDVIFELSLTDFVFQQTHGFTWLQEVTPGNHTVKVEMSSTNNYTGIGGRTLNVSIYKP